MIPPEVSELFRPLEAACAEQLAPLVPLEPLSLILTAVANRAVTLAEPDDLARAGRDDPLVDRRLRAAYRTAFADLCPTLLGTGLTSQVAAIDQALAARIVPA